MGFQIKDKKGTALSMDALDLEAANFFLVEYDEENYAKPIPGSLSWYNVIGYSISNNNVQWSDVIAHILKICTIGIKSYHEIEAVRPYIELCLYWQHKGYVPMYVP